MEKIEYYIDRTRSIVLAVDTANIESDCKAITFFNMGDTPCFIEVVGGIKRRLLQYQQVSFGTDIPGVMEENRFNLTFDALVTIHNVLNICG